MNSTAASDAQKRRAQPTPSPSPPPPPTLHPPSGSEAEAPAPLHRAFHRATVARCESPPHADEPAPRLRSDILEPCGRLSPCASKGAPGGASWAFQQQQQQQRIFVCKRTFSVDSPHFGKGAPFVEWEYASASSGGDAGGGGVSPPARGARTSRAVGSHGRFWRSGLASQAWAAAAAPPRAGCTHVGDRLAAARPAGTPKSCSRRSNASDESEEALPEEQHAAAPLSSSAAAVAILHEQHDRYVGRGGGTLPGATGSGGVGFMPRRLHSAPPGGGRTSGGADKSGSSSGVNSPRGRPPPVSFALRYRRTVASYSQQSASRVGAPPKGAGEWGMGGSSCSSDADDGRPRSLRRGVVRRVRRQTMGLLLQREDDRTVSDSASVSSTSSSEEEDAVSNSRSS